MPVHERAMRVHVVEPSRSTQAPFESPGNGSWCGADVGGGLVWVMNHLVLQQSRVPRTAR